MERVTRTELALYVAVWDGLSHLEMGPTGRPAERFHRLGTRSLPLAEVRLGGGYRKDVFLEVGQVLHVGVYYV